MFNTVVVTNQRCVPHRMLRDEGPCVQLYKRGDVTILQRPGNIVARTPGPGEDEESELRTNTDFRILMVNDTLECNI